eukprot:SAG11_NODE_7693_length_1109_cov_1.375248_2_plen_67_part_01
MNLQQLLPFVMLMRSVLLNFAYSCTFGRRANALLPAGAPLHKVLRYVDTFISTVANDSALFADAWVT